MDDSPDSVWEECVGDDEWVSGEGVNLGREKNFKEHRTDHHGIPFGDIGQWREIDSEENPERLFHCCCVLLGVPSRSHRVKSQS